MLNIDIKTSPKTVRHIVRHKLAIECYKKALEIDPKDPAAWSNLGIVYDNKNEYDKAIECYKKALAIDPKDGKAWNNIIIAYMHKNEYDKVIECYKNALAIDPNLAYVFKKFIKKI